jgi:hypothetical protein
VQVLNACVEPVRKSLPLDLKKTWITADDIDFRSYPAYLQDFRRIGIERVQVLA